MTTNRTLSRLGRMARLTPLLAAAAVFLGGCADEQKQRATALEQENAELRAQNDNLTAALTDAENRRSAAERDAEGLRAQRTLGRGGSGADSGFGGLDGVSVSNRAGDVVVEVAGDVLFDSGKVTLKSSAKQTLDSIASTLNGRYGGNQIRVAGYTDSDPIKKSSWKTNERLSAERALAVEDYLASKGVSKNRMYVAAYGPASPKGSKKDSRRVEIVILAQGSS